MNFYASVVGETEPDQEVHWQRFSVPFEYPVAFSHGIFTTSNPVLAELIARAEPHRRHRCLFVVDEGVLGAVPRLEERIEEWCRANDRRIELAAKIIPIRGGEAAKADTAHLTAIEEAILAHGIDRHSCVIAVGGGAVLDVVGLAAATAHRGVRHIRVPTTVLSQNDSGVGVKNAVNLKGVKNFIGTFAPPWAVVNDSEFREHLPRRERIAGIAEAVKVALIRDRAFFQWIEANATRLTAFDRSAEEYMIRHCAKLHMKQIADGGDPFERGSARPLDFGHWSAHKLESLSGHAVNHGEAVAIGIALDARYSVLAGLLPEGEEERIATLLERLGFRVYHPALERPGKGGRPAVLAGLDEFRQHLGGELTITLLSALGVGVDVHRMDADLVCSALEWLGRREAMR
ncbi:3-dehydroquinate synthase [Nitratireductor sp. GCM10026969]|uniref:3-dehydroquinate synthase n=1 Tax=Nitratireductor sp. GCM10026969 TaxID=3252645 RepID=UPI00360800BB